MKTRLFGFALATSMLVSTTAALAADMPGPPPVDNLRGSYDWTGLYIGAFGGLACMGSNGYLWDGSNNWLMSGCGGKAGIIGGYNYQVNNIVFGVEGDYAWGKKNWIRNNDVGATNSALFGYDLDGIATLRARVGWAIDRTLLFVTGGAAYARGTLHSVGAGTLPTNPISNHLWGWTIGGGVEQAITDNFHLRLDYLYAHMGSKNYSAGCCNTTVHWGGEHEVRIGATWNFSSMW